MLSTIEALQTQQPPSQQPVAVYHHSEQRSRGLHTFLRIPLACCFGGSSKGAVTCAIDFTDNSEVNDNDNPIIDQQHKKKTLKKKTTKKKTADTKEIDNNNNNEG